MRKITKILLGTAGAASVAVASLALAQPGMGPGPFPHGDMTKAEAQQRAEQMFEHMDANNDGKLDKADRAARQAERFDRIDTNNDGMISREEFAAKHEHMWGHGPMGGREGGPPDGDGWPGMRHHKGRMGHAMMKQADTDGDGVISKAEFLTAHAAMFDKADTNKDGTVTDSERRATFKDMRGKWCDQRGGQADQ